MSWNWIRRRWPRGKNTCQNSSIMCFRFSIHDPVESHVRTCMKLVPRLMLSQTDGSSSAFRPESRHNSKADVDGWCELSHQPYMPCMLDQAFKATASTSSIGKQTMRCESFVVLAPLITSRRRLNSLKLHRITEQESRKVWHTFP